ncbi:MAG: lysophospholipid acyltransferase family protein [Nitrospirota bacterium]|jgi:1-acyl-sn-glycerol-3-phosphate acyltransferase
MTYMVRYWRIVYKLLGAVAVTAISAVPVIFVAVVTAGHPHARARVGSRMSHLWARLLLPLFAVRVRRTGNVPATGTMVVANHLSYLDILCLASCYPGLFLSKSEVAAWPGIGVLARAAGTVFIDREQSRDTGRVNAELAGWLRAGLRITWFPEAATSSGATVAAFKSSLFQAAVLADVPCIPATLSVSTPGSADPPARTVCWYGATPFPGHFIRLLALPRVAVTVHFGASVAPAADRKQLARDLHARVLAAFVPVAQ